MSSVASDNVDVDQPKKIQIGYSRRVVSNVKNLLH